MKRSKITIEMVLEHENDADKSYMIELAERHIREGYDFNLKIETLEMTASEDIKCTECGWTSSAEDWDKATQKVFGPNCIKIMDAIEDNMDDDYEPWFICPQCEEQVEERQVIQL